MPGKVALLLTLVTTGVVGAGYLLSADNHTDFSWFSKASRTPLNLKTGKSGRYLRVSWALLIKRQQTADSRQLNSRTGAGSSSTAGSGGVLLCASWAGGGAAHG